MIYRYVNVRINSANDASIWCENFVKFGPVAPELIQLIFKIVTVVMPVTLISHRYAIELIM